MSTKLSKFYERAGKVQCLRPKNGEDQTEGSVTIVGAVSPSGGDFSDPVVTATLNIIQVFWALDKNLADKKHYPAINWSKSYTNYEKGIEELFDSNYTDFSLFR